MSNSEDITSQGKDTPQVEQPEFIASTQNEIRRIFSQNAFTIAMEPVYNALAKFGISWKTDGMQFAKMIDARNQQIMGEIQRRDAANDPNYHLKKDQIQKAA